MTVRIPRIFLWLAGGLATVEIAARPPGVVHDSVLHDWPAADGSLRVLLTRPIAEPLRRIGPKVTFVHDTADGSTPLTRIRELAAESGAAVIETPDVHLSYPLRSAGLLRQEIERAPEPER